MNRTNKIYFLFFRMVTIVAIVLFNLIPVSPVFAASLAFENWGSEIADMNQVESSENAQFSGGVMHSAEVNASFSAVYLVDLSSIATAVDAGEAHLDYSFSCAIVDEGDEQNDSGQLQVTFIGPNSSQSQTCSAADQGGKASSVTIPAGTSAIQFAFTGTITGDINTVSYSGLSIIIDDINAPRITASAAPSLEGGATVSITIAELGSGVDAVYYGAGDLHTSDFPSAGTVLELDEGSASFTAASGGTYTIYASDQRGNENVQAVEVNTYPSIEDLIDQAVDEDNTLNFPFMVADQETSAGSLVISAVSADPLLIRDEDISTNNVDGLVSVSLVLVENTNGATTLSFIVTDEGGLTRQQDIAVNVFAVNDVPLANPDSASTSEDIAVSLDVLSNDSNPDHGSLTIAIINGPTNGEVVIHEDGTLTYTPNLNFAGSDAFMYQITDPVGEDTASTSVTITVNGVDDAPQAVDDTYSLDEDSDLSLDVLSNDLDVEGDSFAISSYTEVSNGSLVLDTDTGIFTYTPAANYFGTDAFTYTIQQVSDADLVSTGLVTITVNSVNDAPQPSYAASISTDEDTPVNASVTVSDADLDAISFYVKDGNSPSHGTLDLVDGDYTYHPQLDFNGSDSFTITVSDGTVEVDCPITVIVNAINDNPVVVYSSESSTDEDNALNMPFSASDADLDVLTIFIKEGNEPLHGILTLGESTYTYTPAANYHGSDAFTISVTDGTTEVDCAIVIVVNAINDAPVPSYLASISTYEDTPISESISATDVDLDEVTITVKDGMDPIHGTLVLNEGNYTYTPVENFHGTDAFTLLVSDGTADVDCAVTVTVNSVNDAPTASFETSVSVDEDVVLNEPFVSMDVDGDILTTTVKEANQPAHGTLELVVDGYTYTPAANFDGTDGFSITVSDGSVEVDFAIAVTIIAVNDAPVLSYASNIATDEDTTSNQSFTASDVDLDELTISIKEKNEPAHGTAVLVEGGYSYSPDANYNGSDAFNITVGDGTQEVDAPIAVTIHAVNDAPVPAYSASIQTDEDTPMVESFSATDIDLDELTYYVKDGHAPAHGTLELGTGSYTYTPALNFNGTDAFTITVFDGTVEVDCAVIVTINAVNDAPVPTYSATISTDEDVPIDEDLTASDVDLDVLTYSVKDENAPVHGEVVLVEGGYTYTPDANFNGSDGFIVTVSDGTTEVDCTVSVTINPVNDAPVPVYTAAISTDEDALISETLTASDIDLDALSYTVQTGNGPEHGTLDLIEGGYIYTPVLNFNGMDSFTITVSDGSAQVNCSITVTVNSINDTPIAVDDSASTAEDTPVEISVLANDSDVDIPDGDVIVPSRIVSGPSHGNAVIDGTTITYTPALNYFGADEFTYEITDLGGLTASAVVSITVAAVNDYPQAEGLLAEYSCDEDAVITISFNLTDVETPTETLTMQVVSGNTSVVTQNRIIITGLEDTDPAVSIRITPLANQNGDVPFTLRASDGFQTAVYTFTLHVAAVNDAPVAKNDTIGFTEDTPLTFSISQLLNNDTDIDNSQASLVFDTIISTTAHGLLVNNGDGTLTYTPDANYRGSDTFIYRIHDPDGAEDTATVTLNATGVNDPPTISAIDDLTIDEDGTISVAFTVDDPDLLTETELNTLMITSSSSNPGLLDANNMRATGSGNNRTFSAAPLADKNGMVTVTITVSDGIVEASEEFVVTITPVPDDPVAEADFFYVRDYGSTNIDPLENDWDADDDCDLTPTIASSPAHGSLTADGDAYLYTPDGTFSGSDVFTYYITDSTGRTSSTVTVTLSADPANHPPVITKVNGQTIFEDEYGSVTFTVTDEDGNLDSIYVISSNTTIIPASGLELSNEGSTYTLVFTPAANQAGKLIITIYAEDLRGNISSKFFNVQVVPVNDLPTAVDDVASTDEDTAVVFNVLSNDYDVETASANLILSRVLSFPSHGRISSVGNGQFRYMPNGDFNGTDLFSYEILDRDGGTDSATVLITINSVNDAPEAYANYLTTIVEPGGTLDNINVIGNDTDPDLPYDINEEIHVTSIVSQPNCGTAYVNLDGTLKYEAFNGEIACAPAWIWFTYAIEDHYGASASASVSIPVDTIEANLMPRVVNIWRSMQEDGATITIDLSNYAFDADGDTLTYALVLTDAPNTNIGTATISGSVVSYTPAPNKNASYAQENFTYSVSDGHSTVEATIYVEVVAVNDVPTISMDAGSIIPIPDQVIDEDNALALDFYIDDVDKEDTGTTFGLDDLSLTIYSHDFKIIPPESISFTRNDTTGLISLSITPPENESGSPTITVVVSDGITYATDSFNLAINAVNDPPSAQDFSTVTDEEVPAHIQVVNDLCDVDEGETFTITQETAPDHGSLTFDNVKGEIIYTPTPNYYGADSFTYRLTDSGGLSNTGVVSVTINNVNDAPLIRNLAPIVETQEDTSVTVTFNVTDVDNTLEEISLSTVASDPSLVASTSFVKSTDGSGLVTMTINPGANLSGTTTIEINASDGDKSALGNLTLKIYAINDPPIAVDDAATTDEDHSVTINVIANDTDIEDPTTLYVVSTTAPLLTGSGAAGHGRVVNNNDGTLTYTPGADRTEDVYFTYQISDSGNLRTNATVFITINAMNDAPRLANDSRTTGEDVPITINVLVNDHDIEGDEFSINSHTDPLHGTVELNLDQTFTYTPELNYFGTDSFRYTVEEDEHSGVTATASVSLTITATDDYPIVETTEPWVLQEDTPKTFSINISDAETPSANLLITLTSLDTDLIKNYNVILQGSGTFRSVKLTPQLQVNGALQLQVEVNDGGLTTTELIDIVIEAVNDPPVAQNYTATTAEDAAVSGLVVVKSDIDLLHEGDSHSYTLGDDGAHGSALIQLDGNWAYTPNSNFNGTDSFTVVVTDHAGATAISTVSITVSKVNDTPLVTSDNQHAIDEDTPANGTIVVDDPDVFDSVDPDSLSMVVTNPPEHGTVILNAISGEYSYTPAANYNGTDSFTVTVVDEHAAQAVKVVQITVDPVNDVPDAVDDSSSVLEDHRVTIDVLGNDSDIDLSREGDDLTIQSVDDVDNGTVQIAMDGKSLDFISDHDWNGEESFTYTIQDQAGATDTATVVVTVDPINDPPIISDIANQTIAEDGNTGTLAFSVTDVDNDDAALTVTATTSNGTIIPLDHITFGGSGSDRTVTITPLGDKNTWDHISASDQPITITLTVSDGYLTDSDSYTITIEPVNDAPIARNDAATGAEDHTINISVLANDSDVDLTNEGDNLHIINTTGVDNGTVQIALDGKSLSFIPDADWFGVEEFTYTITDGAGATASATVQVTVTAVNDGPIISDISNQEIDEDTNTGALTFTITDVDTDLDILSITASSNNSAVVPTANIVLGGSGSNRTVTITPAANKNTWNKNTASDNPLTITLQIDDGELTDSDTFLLAVIPINDVPLAINDNATMDEDSSVTVSLLNNDSDIDLSNEGDDLTIKSVTGEVHGHVSIATDKKTFIYTADTNWNGVEDLSYVIQDLAGTEATAMVYITVRAVNDAPIALDDLADTEEDVSVTIFVLQNDSDIDTSFEGDDLTIEGTAGLNHGTVTIATDKKSITFIPTANWNGTEVFTYEISDENGATASASVSVTVSSVDDDPTANDDTFTILEDSGTTALNVLANDTDPDLVFGDELELVSIIFSTSHGTLVINAGTKRIEYTPDLNYIGLDSFTYQIKDNQDPAVYACAEAVIHITPVNDVPVINSINEHVIDEEDSVSDVVTISDPDINDTPDPDSHTFNIDAAPAHGSVILDEHSGEYTYTPMAQYNGTDSFTVRVTDEHAGSVTRLVRVTINPVNDAPTATSASYNTPEDIPINKVITASDADIATNGDFLTFALKTGSAPSHGSVILDSLTGEFLYSPEPNYNGTDGFSVIVTDTQGESAQADISIYVNYYENDPTANDDTFSMDEDAISVVLDVLANDEDADIPYGDSLIITAVTTAPAHGSAVIDGVNQTIIYTPAPNFNGIDIFNYEIKDNQDPAVYDIAQVTLTIIPINDPPIVTSSNSHSIDEDTSVTDHVIATDADLNDTPNPDSLSFRINSSPSHGNVVLDENTGEYTYTAHANYNGTDTFIVLVADEHGVTTTKTVMITINAVDDDPLAKADAYQMDENDDWKSMDVLANDEDADLPYGDVLTLTQILAAPTHGSVRINTVTNRVEYKPAANYHGNDSFTYEIKDNQNPIVASSAVVTIVIDEVVPAPIVTTSGTYYMTPQNIYAVLYEDTVVEGSATKLAGNSRSTFALDAANLPHHGRVDLNTITGYFTFTPDKDFNGEDSFTILISDGTKTTGQTIFLTITPVNDPPTGRSILEILSKGETVQGRIPVNDVDIVTNGDKLTYSIVRSPEHGEVDLIPLTGMFRYTPQSGYTGADTFTIRITDEFGAYMEIEIKVLVDGNSPAAADLKNDDDISKGIGYRIAFSSGVINPIWVILVPFFFILMLIHNVRITFYTTGKDGKVKKHIKRKWVILGKDDEVILNLDPRMVSKNPNEAEILLLRSFVKKFRGKTLILNVKSTLRKAVSIEPEDGGRMRIKI